MASALRRNADKPKRTRRAKHDNWDRFRISTELKNQLHSHCDRLGLDFSEWARDTLEKQMHAEQEKMGPPPAEEDRITKLERLVSALTAKIDRDRN